MIKEIIVGITTALIIILFLEGVNIIPFLFFGCLLLGLYYLLGTKNLSRNFISLIKNSNKDIISFENIGGQKTAKRELMESLDFIRNQTAINKMGIRPLKGVLLVGPSGTGKTLLAKAAANYTDAVFLATSGSEFIEMYAGVGAQRVRKIFQQADREAKKQNKSSAIIFIDEIDILGGKRGSHSSHLEYDQTLNQLLVEMDGINNKEGGIKILLLAATNRIDILDTALLRPGRFDRTVNVDLPDMKGRLEILFLYSKNKPLAKDVNLESLAKETFGFSGAHLESLVNEAAILAMREKSKSINALHFSEAIEKVIMGERLEKRPDAEQLWRIAVHETGHALISEKIRNGSVSSITTTSRGKALGYVRQIPDKDNYLYTKEYLEGQIGVFLGGAKAEEIVLENLSTGSENDFQEAFRLAKKIISSGMSPLGIVNISMVPQKILYDAIRKILSTEEKKVEILLTEQLVVLKKIAGYLLENEKISGDYLRSKLLFQNHN